MHWQSELIDAAVRGFFVSLAQAVLIVLAVLWLAMGWRMGVIIGSSIILTILGTFVVMAAAGHRPAAHVAGGDDHRAGHDGRQLDRRRRGRAGAHAARHGPGEGRRRSGRRSRPGRCLAPPLVAVLAFYPIAASTENAGEYCASLFSVAAISSAAELGPLGHRHAAPMRAAAARHGRDGRRLPKEGRRLIRGFRALLESAIRHRILTLATAVGLLVAAIVGFGAGHQAVLSGFLDAEVPDRLPPGRRCADRGRGRGSGRDREEAARTILASPASPASSALARHASTCRSTRSRSRRTTASSSSIVHDHRDVGALMDELDPWLQGELPAGRGPASPVCRWSRPYLEVRSTHLRPGARIRRHAARTRRQGRGNPEAEPAYG